MALTDTRLRNLKPDPKKAERLVADGNGLYIRIRAGEGYDLILCDWKMPGFSGKQVIDEMRIRHPDTMPRLVFMSGDVMGESRDMIEETGSLFLAKPFTFAEILAVAERIFAAEAPRGEL